MSISSISSISDVTTAAAGQKTLGKQDFLNLLLKQLSYQDPLNPMDSTEFTTQLSQFSSLEELNNINDTLNSVLAFQQSMQNATIANFIGKNVTASGNSAYLQDTADINYELAGDAKSVVISVMDSSGKLVWSKDIGAQSAGDQSYVWDGTDDQGNKLPPGVYTFDVQAKDGSEAPVQSATNASGIVTGVVFEDGVTYLVLEGGRKIHLSDIKSIG